MSSPSTTERRPPAVIGVDSREHEEWFAELPESAKQKFRAQWEKKARQQEVRNAHRRERLVQCLIEGAAMYLLVEICFYSFTVLAVVGALGLGSLVGWLWHVWACGRAGSALLGILGFLGMRMLCGMGGQFQVVCALPVVICLSMAMAIPRESGRLGA